MRFALVSDIHGNLPALEAVIADIRSRGIVEVANLGDLLSGPLWPRETADLLSPLGWVTITGNHDRELVEKGAAAAKPSDRYAFGQITPAQLRWLEALPATASLDDGRVRLVHGTPADDCVYLLDEIDGGRLQLSRPDQIAPRLAGVTAGLVACGHSHLPRLVTVPGGPSIVNPGSVGLQAFDAEPGPHLSETGSPHARYAIVERADERWTVTFVAIEYDWERAAVQADRNDRPEWGRRLRSGYAR